MVPQNGLKTLHKIVETDPRPMLVVEPRQEASQLSVSGVEPIIRKEVSYLMRSNKIVSIRVNVVKSLSQIQVLSCNVRSQLFQLSFRHNQAPPKRSQRVPCVSMEVVTVLSAVLFEKRGSVTNSRCVFLRERQN